jgi:predicted RNA-binding Zn ribbon-like protein
MRPAETSHFPIETFDLVGGRICLDFTNTVGCWFDADPRDKLADYEDLLVFAGRVGAVDEDARRGLAAEAARRPADAARVVDEARALRGAIFALFYPGGVGRAAALTVVDGALARARAGQHLVAAGDGFTLAFAADPAALDRPLWPIAVSAAELLCSADAARVRACGSGPERCTWLFIDESKNHSRRWCTMRDCGNRAKARRHYQKKRAS